MERFWWGGSDDDSGDDSYGYRDGHDCCSNSNSNSSSFVVDDIMQDFESIFSQSRMTSSPRPTRGIFDDLSDDVIVFVKDLPRPNSDFDEDDRGCGEAGGWEIVSSNLSAVREDQDEDQEGEGDEGSTAALVWELGSVSSSVLTTSRRTFRDVLLSSVNEEVVDFSQVPFRPNLVVENRQKQQTAMKKPTEEANIDECDNNKNDDGLLEDIRDSIKTCRGGKFRHLYNRERKQGGGSKHGQQQRQQHQHQDHRRLHGFRQTTDKFGRAHRAERENKNMKTMCRKKMYY
eukprot:CAMPEP_0113471182 /NCGR_PEP_ID=MMETSP0014_2-20120614/16845_1 /TAXON_ID=2857 /ORGANISM="Nitzschia sp." /LENGTH=287 /DNA_ID=CAMNT_0000363807 /DNA_START=175 /DNA_END=1038 /DNA_ORIENTATION=- /assembly_acc=CAM_ASM_000159